MIRLAVESLHDGMVEELEGDINGGRAVELEEELMDIFCERQQ